MKTKLHSGFSIVEILVSIGIFSIIVFSVFNVFLVSQEAARMGSEKTKAIPLMNEYLEKVRNIRRMDWNLLTNNRFVIVENQVTHNLELQPTVMGETIGNHTRYLDIADACRDGLGVLVVCGSGGDSVDPSSKEVTVTISWIGAHPGDLIQSTYLTRYLDNLAWTQTTVTDFNAGTNNGTTVTNTAGGEVVLGAGGHADWCEPVLDIAGLDLPRSGVANAISAIVGRAFAGTGDNASGESFLNINLSNDDPPVASILGTANEGKTNDVFGDTNYGYIATDTNAEEVVILDLTSPAPYQKIGHFNAPTNSDAASVFVSGTTGYVMTEGYVLWNFDLTSLATCNSSDGCPRYDLDGLDIGEIGRSIFVQGNYAYIAVKRLDHQMLIVDVSDRNNMQVVGWADFRPAPGVMRAAGGRDVFVNPTGTRAYLVTDGSSLYREFWIVDITNKIGARGAIASYDTNGMSPMSVEVVPGGRAIVVGLDGEEYQVLNVADETSPVRCGGMEVNSGIMDSASILEPDNDAFSYIVTRDASAEFRIIAGGPGGHYSSSGIYESQTKDTSYPTAFNRFFVNATTPSQSSIGYRIAIKDASGGSCIGVTFSDFDFVGPDGTISSRFSGDDAIPLDDNGNGYENPGQCVRIRAYLETSDFSQTPTLYDFTVNYSP